MCPPINPTITSKAVIMREQLNNTPAQCSHQITFQYEKEQISRHLVDLKLAGTRDQKVPIGGGGGNNVIRVA